jgi:hypothetical protein
MVFKCIAPTLGLLMLAGCAASRIDVPTTHPANPAAPEAPVRPESTTLKQEPSTQALPENGAPVAGHTRHQHGTAALAPYQCPMHPEVRSDKPGRCPKCGMHLKKGDGE